ncbi:MAG TPA: L,D-transpeptidase [Burkholderiaceae bacterium]
MSVLAGAALQCRAEQGLVTVETIRGVYSQSVEPRIAVPEDVAHRYAALLLSTLDSSDRQPDTPQYVILVDRSPKIQVLFLFWLDGDGGADLLGASPVSTGKATRFDHFETPVGIFLHTPDNPDFRAEGTKNENGIRGYGVKGERVFDFGWQQGKRGWGRHDLGEMRLQMHATDPDLLEQRLGSVQSKGCIRIPASLNRLIDHYGLLDRDYEAAEQEGRHQWVLATDREAAASAGNLLVIVDTGQTDRPYWNVKLVSQNRANRLSMPDKPRLTPMPAAPRP